MEVMYVGCSHCNKLERSEGYVSAMPPLDWYDLRVPTANQYDFKKDHTFCSKECLVNFIVNFTISDKDLEKAKKKYTIRKKK